MRLAVLAFSIAVSGCASLPSQDARQASFAMQDTASTRLGRGIAPELAAHPGKTGVYPLQVPADAFAARALLAAAADRSLDVQYYIWHGDRTGWLMFEALWHAAQRGVRVRLLLDDNGVAGLDDVLVTLDAHPNIEVRLYNPFARRSLRALGYLTDFARLNRRMHNKSFTADGQATIVGGRNVGDEYFGAGEGVVFEDLDVVAVGAAVREVSEAFDLYWNSASAYPASAIVGAAPDGGAAFLEERFAAAHADPESLRYVRALRETPLVRELLAGKLPLDWSHAQLLRDDPAKTLDTTGRTDVLLFKQLLGANVPPQTSFDLISPYFVPGKEGTEALAALARGGVAVRVLTNSLDATDVGAVHAGYIKRRADLLRAGVRLYELKRTAQRGQPRGSQHSSASLHAKTFAIDARHVFVGSFNFDQRSAHLNTELGLLIDSPVLGKRLLDTLERELPSTAYQVKLTPDDKLQWISGESTYTSEPGTGPLRRAWIWFLSVLPIEWLL